MEDPAAAAASPQAIAVISMALRSTASAALPPCMESATFQRDTGRAMSQENVEVVRRYYEAYGQDGFDPWMEYWSDEIDHRTMRDGIDDPGPIRGKSAMRAHIRDWLDTFDDFWFEAVELIDAGEDTVVAVERFGGRAKLSGVETEQTSGVVLTIREGKIARCREYATRAEALEAAGLRE